MCNNKINDKAIKHFGTTTNILEAGYILTNGIMLDFSGKKDGGESNVRYIDHREIQEILESNGTNALIEFMNLGNIRLNPESKGIDISINPTEKQILTLRNYFNYFNGEIIVDISDIKGRNIKTFEYNKRTASSKIINDIMEYFNKQI
jgi:hypothetical protein